MRTCFDIDAYESHEARMAKSAPPGSRIYLTKHPGELLRVGPRLRVDPDFHVICLLRDPRDTVVSKHRKAPDRYWASLRYWNTYTPVLRSLGARSRFTTVRYEDFTRDPDQTQRDLADALPFLTPTAPFTRYHEVAEPSAGSLDALRGVRPITPASVGAWREHLPRVRAQIETHGSISDDLVEYGYEVDSSWEKELEGVEPDRSPSYWPEHFTPEDLAARRRGRYKQAAKAILRRMGLSKYRP